MSNSFLESAKRTLKLESQGISDLIQNLDENFSNICEEILNCKGRIVTLGVVKFRGR